jgi:hypothetical protein
MTERATDAGSEREGRERGWVVDLAETYCFSVRLGTRSRGETIMITT